MNQTSHTHFSGHDIHQHQQQQHLDQLHTVWDLFQFVALKNKCEGEKLMSLLLSCDRIDSVTGDCGDDRNFSSYDPVMLLEVEHRVSFTLSKVMLVTGHMLKHAHPNNQSLTLTDSLWRSCWSLHCHNLVLDLPTVMLVWMCMWM